MKQIQIRQNEDSSLNAQYTARYYFNRAEIFNLLVWIFCILSFFSVLIPQTASGIVVYGIPFLLDILAALMVLAFNKFVAFGAKIRASFDDYVFGFSDKLNMSQALKECIVKVIEKHPVQAEIQKRNSGNDIQPGVRNWYNTNSEKDGLDAIFSCQKENTWWEKKLIWPKLIYYGFIILVCIVLFSILKTIGHISALQILLSSALLLRAIERIYENIKYFYIGNKIDGQIELLEKQKSKELLIGLQSTINDRRSLKIFGVNFIYRILANKLSDMYEKTKD